MLMANPLHFPEVLCSFAHELLIFSRLACSVQTAAFLEPGWPLCFGEAYCCTVRPSDSCYLRPERQNCQRREPEAARSCYSRRPPRSLAPSAIWDHPREETSVTPSVRRRKKSLSTHQGRPQSVLRPLTMVRTLRCPLSPSPPPSPAPVFLLSCHLCISQKPGDWLLGNSTRGANAQANLPSWVRAREPVFQESSRSRWE